MEDQFQIMPPGMDEGEALRLGIKASELREVAEWEVLDVQLRESSLTQ
jgi:hypothetical protein